MVEPEEVNYCGACGDNQNPIQTVCKKCRKEARNVLKAYTTDEQFTNHQCNHLVHNPKLKMHTVVSGWNRRMPKCYEIPWGHLNGGTTTKCGICRDEMRKELALRYRKNRKREANEERVTESLLTKCCKVIALDPGLLLVAAVHNPPLPDTVWEKINGQVPASLSKEYDEALTESMVVNEAEWMYRTIGEVFSRYIQRRRGGF